MRTIAEQRNRISQKVAVGVVYVAVMFISIMDITIVNTALPTIGRDFSVSPTSVDSISIAYLVSLSIFIPASGWLGDRFGGKRVLLSADRHLYRCLGALRSGHESEPAGRLQGPPRCRRWDARPCRHGHAVPRLSS